MNKESIVYFESRTHLGSVNSYTTAGSLIVGSSIYRISVEHQVFLKKVMDVIVTYMHIQYKGARPLPFGYEKIKAIQYIGTYNETDKAFLNELGRVYKKYKVPTLNYTDGLARRLIEVLHIIQ